MKEIGSEFWNVPTHLGKNNSFFENTNWFLSGRSALRAIILDIKSKQKFTTVAMPSWCCDSMIVPFIENGIGVNFYPVYYEDGLVQDLNNIDTDAVLLMDYFGYTHKKKYINYDGIIIRDVTQSIFSATYHDADYYFGSLRKWAGFWTAGFAWDVEPKENKDEKYIELRKTAMEKKSDYLSGSSTSKDYLDIYQKAEEYLDSRVTLSGASYRDLDLVEKLDIESIKIKRKKNAKILLEEFRDIVIFQSFKESDCPMFVPVLVPSGKRNELRQYLIERKIYCPTHWPISTHHKLTTQTKKIYEDELSLVCDQRYNEEDMFFIIETIKNFWKEK